MRIRLTRLVLVALAAANLIALRPTASEADVDCQWQSRLFSTCTVQTSTEPERETDLVADDGPADTGSGSSCHFDPSKQGFTSVPAGPVPCTSELGYWVNSLGCYVRVLDPQPAADDPAWGGRNSADGGAVYGCYQPLPVDIDVYLWLASTPAASGAGPSPRAVAEMAVDQMNLQAIEIGIVPEPRPGYIGIVGQPVWMWTTDPAPNTIGPITASASAGGITVSATARIQRITWSMGDGSTVVCVGPGTAFTDAFAGTASPDCGHVYTTSSAGQPGDKFTVTAASDWVIDWAGAGQTGTIRMGGLERSVQIAVGEAQVLVTS